MKYLADGPYHSFVQKPNVVQSSTAMDRTQNIDFSKYITILCMLHYITLLYHNVITRVQLKMLIFPFFQYIMELDMESIDRELQKRCTADQQTLTKTLVDNQRIIHHNPCFTFLKKQFAHVHQVQRQKCTFVPAVFQPFSQV